MGLTSIPTWERRRRRGHHEPIHRADPSGPDDQARRGDDAGGGVAPHRAHTPRRALGEGPPSIFGPGGAAWPDEPWWKLSGLFELTYDQSIQAGVADLEAAMADYGNDHLVIYGYSQGAMIAIREKRKLAAQYPAETKAPDIDFVLGGDPNLPNGGLAARFRASSILGLTFDGPEPTDTPFDTVVITRQYELIADIPLYPLNLVADLNAVLGFIFVHLYAFDVSLAPDPSTSPPIQSQPRRHRLLLLRDSGPAVVRSAAHPGGARVADRRGGAVLPGHRGAGL